MSIQRAIDDVWAWFSRGTVGVHLRQEGSVLFMDTPVLADRFSALDHTEGDGFAQRLSMIELDGFALSRMVVHPLGAAKRTCMVICPSMFELPHFQPFETRLMHELARSGFPSTVIQPPGHGDSAGSITACTLEHRVRTALAAFEAIRMDHPGIETVSFFGARLGGAVALATDARSESSEGLVMWNPVFDSEGYWRDACRLHRLMSVAGAGLGLPRWPTPDKQLTQTGLATVLEIAVDAGVREDLKTLDAWTRKPPESDSSTFIAASSDKSVARASDTLGGRSVRTFSLGLPSAVQVGVGPETRAMVAPTVEWMSEVFP